jgi:hypothetical protein
MRRRLAQRVAQLATGASARTAPAFVGSIHTGAAPSAAEAAVRYADSDGPSTSGRAFAASHYGASDLRQSGFDSHPLRAGSGSAAHALQWRELEVEVEQEPPGAEKLAATLLPPRPAVLPDDLELVMGAAENERQICYPLDADASFRAYAEQLRAVQHPGVGDNLPWEQLQELYLRCAARRGGAAGGGARTCALRRAPGAAPGTSAPGPAGPQLPSAGPPAAALPLPSGRCPGAGPPLPLPPQPYSAAPPPRRPAAPPPRRPLHSPPTTTPGTRRQLELESAAYQQATQRWQEDARAAMGRGAAADLRTAQKLTDGWFSKVSHAISREQWQVGGAGSASAASAATAHPQGCRYHAGPAAATAALRCRCWGPHMRRQRAAALQAVLSDGSALRWEQASYLAHLALLEADELALITIQSGWQSGQGLMPAAAAAVLRPGSRRHPPLPERRQPAGRHPGSAQLGRTPAAGRVTDCRRATGLDISPHALPPAAVLNRCLIRPDKGHTSTHQADNGGLFPGVSVAVLASDIGTVGACQQPRPWPVLAAGQLGGWAAGRLLLAQLLVPPAHQGRWASRHPHRQPCQL